MLESSRLSTADAREGGATAVEYAILAAAIAAIVVAAVVVLGGETCRMYELTSDGLDAAKQPAAAPVDACD